MGRPSLIQVVDLKKLNNNETTTSINSGPASIKVSFGLQGCVEIDDFTTIEVG
jgi:hypothetical protein